MQPQKYIAVSLDRLDISAVSAEDDPVHSAILFRITSGKSTINYAVTLDEFLQIADDLAAHAAAVRGEHGGARN